ncbi:hypothetical protein SAMN04487866_101516 [Thermoactinomyces sp. DSM 45891]|uniref:hypothetical protein n=1 Tax=Thermoactinomyces sp. DSM 45891 TaxID=1761907 RepID=UPI00091C3A34|nr:hypothetical protein [Thermoactinomyces sp. DSM 45891]SFX09788.1 hypothetical protein SAMN04487866_101516 [Thermoactinomyces sp. DSM 45891]
MIKLTNLRNVSSEINGSYTPEVNTYNIVSGFMSDNSRPFRVSQSIMFWINESGFLGEIECIYPAIVNEWACNYADRCIKEIGFPQLEIITPSNQAYVQSLEEGFIIWFSKGELIDLEIAFSNAVFLFSGNELVGLKISPILIVE